MSGIRGLEVEVRTKSEASTFEDLEVFRRAYRVSLDLHRVSLQFPKIEQHCLADQIRRASKSICGNIAEGHGKQRRSRAEFKRYLLMAIGSADEMQVWLRYCSDLEYIDQRSCAQWRNEYRQIARMLQGLYTTLSSSSDP
jgi:four helix bundle protein